MTWEWLFGSNFIFISIIATRSSGILSKMGKLKNGLLWIWWQFDDTFSGSHLNMNSPHCTFFEHLLLIVSSTTNALPRRLLLFRQDGNHIQKCPFVSQASCVTFSVQQPFHQTRNKKINLSWSAYSIVRIVYVVSCQTKNIHILSRFQIFCTIYIWGGGIKNILQFQFLLFQRQSKNCQHNVRMASECSQNVDRMQLESSQNVVRMWSACGQNVIRSF